MRFEDKTVWITGASSGIGAELARQLAFQKAKLILTARNIEALQQVQKECLRQTKNCSVLVGNLLQADTLDRLTQKAISVHGIIDVVIFCAGQSQRSFAINTEMQVYRQLMELNFFAPIAITKRLLPHFQESGGGHLVAISSMAGLMGFPLRTGYAAAKHALKGFYETLQTENKIDGLVITIVSPGRVQTPISVNAVLGDGKKYGKMDKGQMNGIPVEVCARKIILAIAKKKKHILIAQNEKLLWLLWWFFRPLYYRIARKKGLSD